MTLPVGYHKFHANPFVNYQLNRWYSLGYARKEDLEKAAALANNINEFKNIFITLAEEAMQEGRLKNAATYYRAAEFLVDPDDKDKPPLYEKFNETFYQAFAAEGIERHTVAYKDGYLPSMRLAAKTPDKKGTILLFGGFDSFIEDFFCAWDSFAQSGYDVIAFEGPGQGAAHRRYNLSFTHDWEKPTGAILDYFDLQDVTLIGISMGGYWSLRAAAFEKRIKRVVAFAVVYDWMEQTTPFVKKLVYKMIQWEGFMNAMVRLRMRLFPILKHAINHTLFIIHKKEPIDAIHWLLQMNKDFLHSERVTQDVYLMAGENDKFQPPKLLYKQQAALVNARSITSRIFTKAEHADNHCQMGNFQLALDEIINWLDQYSD